MRVRSRSKFGAIKTEVDGITFDSKAEANRYCQLRLLAMQGTISELARQTRFDLTVNGAHCGFYKADFSYRDFDGVSVIEDVKGKDTPLSALKRKLVKAIYGVDVRLIDGRGRQIIKAKRASGRAKKKGRSRVNEPAQAPA